MPPREIIESIEKARDFAMQSLLTYFGIGGIRPARRLLPKGARSDRMAAQGLGIPPSRKEGCPGRRPYSHKPDHLHRSRKNPSYHCFYCINFQRTAMKQIEATGTFPANGECRKMHFPRAGRVSSRCPWIETFVQNVTGRWTNVAACRSRHTGWVDGGTTHRRTL